MERSRGLEEDIMPPVIDKDKCESCGKCVDICSEDVFFNSKEKDIPVVSYPEACWYCNMCVEICPFPGAIKLRIPANMMVPYKPAV